MNASLTVLDPTDERQAVERPGAARLKTITGQRVTLLDISKARGDIFLDRVAEHLEERGAQVERMSKPTFSRIASAALYQEIAAHSDAVIEALAD